MFQMPSSAKCCRKTTLRYLWHIINFSKSAAVTWLYWKRECCALHVKTEEGMTMPPQKSFTAIGSRSKPAAGLPRLVTIKWWERPYFERSLSSLPKAFLSWASFYTGETDQRIRNGGQYSLERTHHFLTSQKNLELSAKKAKWIDG